MVGPTPETVARARRAIDLIAQGRTIRAATDEAGISVTSFQRAVSGVSELTEGYAHAKEHRAELSADEIVEIADNQALDPQQARNMIDARKWRAARQYARVYGDRVDVQFSGQVHVLEILDRAKLRSIHDLAPIEEAQIVDVPALSASNTTDDRSEGRPDDEPDIFD